MGLAASAMLAAGLAGATYTLTPGPGFLALLGIGAAQGRRAGAGFIFGHFAGDVLWSSLALTAVIGARQIGTGVFDVLGLISGLYLGRLGWRAIRMRAREDGHQVEIVRRPYLRGLVFGLTNPKGYPVAVATFTALLSAQATQLTWSALPALLMAACVGFLSGDIILVAMVGAGTVRRFYRQHEVWIVRGSGVVFLGFAALAITGALPGLWSSFTRAIA